MSFLCKDTCKCQYARTEAQFSWNGLMSDRGKGEDHLYPEDKTLLKPKSPLLRHPFGLTNRHPGANWPDGNLILFCDYLVYSTPFSSVHTDSLFCFTLKKKKKLFTSSSIILPYFMCSVAVSCPTLYDPMECSPPGSSIHRISQARWLEWVAISSSRVSSWPRDQIQVSCVSPVGKLILYHTTWKAHSIVMYWCLFNIFILNLFSLSILR